MSLRLKMMIGICLIFACLLVAMNVFISENIQNNNESIIKGDLKNMQANAQIYARQYLAEMEEQEDGNRFESIAVATVQELTGVTGNPTAAYTTDGTLLATTRVGLFESLHFDDLPAAMDGNMAFTLDTRDGRTVAVCSYPIVADGEDIGIIRTMADYSSIYAYGNTMMQSVSLITAVMFFVALVISLFFIQSISSPIVKLASISGAVARSIERNALSINSIEALLKSRRGDEVGKLSRNFADMIHKIDQQISVINADRQELQRLSDYRKEFYDTVTHELKTPLTSISGYAEVLEENGFTDKPFFTKAIGHIKHESGRMYQMVVALLEMSKLSMSVNSPKEVLDFSSMVVECCEAMQFKAEKYGASIECWAAEDMRVFGNASKLREVLINLLDNAIKYKNPEGNVHVNLKEKGKMVLVSVINNADPIEEAEIPKLFEPFYRADHGGQHEDGSSGLGLAICKQIVEQHAGRISMRNLPGGNVAVEVLLPIYTGL